MDKLSKRFLKKVEDKDFGEKLIENVFSQYFNNKSPEILEISNKDIENELKKSLLEKIDTIPIWFEYSINRQKELVKNFVETKIASENIQISDIDKDILVDNLLNSITNFGAVQDLLDNERVNCVIVNGTKSIHIEIGGKILNTEKSLTEKQLKFLISSISNMSGIDEYKGINQFVIKNIALTVIGEDISLSGINITLKKQNKFTPEFLINKNMMTKEIYDFLVSIIGMKKNIIISGEINSGKTILTDVLCNSCLRYMRAFILEQIPQITSDFNTLSKFKYDESILSFIVKTMPEYLVSDLNYIEPQFVDIKGCLLTIRANSIESAFQALVGMCVVSGLPEKFAKMKALKNFDYIVQLNRDENGTCRITNIVELIPAKTLSASIKTVVKYVDGEYISQIPQPITSMRAKTLK